MKKAVVKKPIVESSESDEESEEKPVAKKPARKASKDSLAKKAKVTKKIEI